MDKFEPTHVNQFRLPPTISSTKTTFMKNVQIIDGAVNATFSVFQATEGEFATIFPDGRDIELVEDLMNGLAKRPQILC